MGGWKLGFSFLRVGDADTQIFMDTLKPMA